MPRYVVPIYSQEQANAIQRPEFAHCLDISRAFTITAGLSFHDDVDNLAVTQKGINLILDMDDDGNKPPIGMLFTIHPDGSWDSGAATTEAVVPRLTSWPPRDKR